MDRTKIPEVDNAKIVHRIHKGYYVMFSDQYFKVAGTRACQHCCCKYRRMLILQSLTDKKDFYMNICPSIFAILKVYKTKWQMQADRL